MSNMPGTAKAVQGFAVLDKPSGITSHSYLSRLSKKLGNKIKSGHAGTLDSFASGVLVCMFGRYTRLSDSFMATTKGYEAEVLFGEETDTLDPLGRVVAIAEVPTMAKLEAVIPQFRGLIKQAAPAFSSVHINGQRAYELALRGEKFEPKVREVNIYSLELLSFNGNYAKLSVTCSKGTYIRSLARDLALAAGSRGRLAALRRSFSGPFRIEEAVKLEDFGENSLLSFTPELAKSLGYEVLVPDKNEAIAFCKGLPLYKQALFAAKKAVPDARVAVFDSSSSFLGIACFRNNSWVYDFVFGGSN